MSAEQKMEKVPFHCLVNLPSSNSFIAISNLFKIVFIWKIPLGNWNLENEYERL